jgi:hypothetical protein
MTFSEALAAIVHHIARHREVYGEDAAALALAFVRCAIKPGVPWDKRSIYKWIYDSVQSTIPGSGHTSEYPTQPVAPAQPPKE